MNGIVFDIKRYAVHDGPGIRTTIFMKGCPLRCIWCHNPESFSPKIEEFTQINRLAEISVEDKIEIGKKYSVDQLLKEIEKDQLFFDESGGGVTFSGGEPLMQVEFLAAMLKECKKMDIHTVVDTSGHASKMHVKQIIDDVDLFLFDLKHMDDTAHQKLTGVSNKQLLENLQYVVESGKNVILRYPIIPAYNDSHENIMRMINLLKKINFDSEIHILPYHRIGKDKYSRFQKENKMPDIPSLTDKDVRWAKELFEKEGFTVGIGG